MAHLFIVSRQQPDLYSYLLREFSEEADVSIVLDRRYGERRQPRERRNSAAKYLAEPQLHLAQITALVGYAEQSTFNRSCRRWFGKTPRQYRAELITPPVPIH